MLRPARLVLGRSLGRFSVRVAQGRIQPVRLEGQFQ